MPRFRTRLHLVLILCLSSFALAQVPPAISTDPSQDAKFPASMVSLAGVPSHGENLLGVFYLASGSGLHPTLILMHGFPGYEQNLDLAQAIRRAGWNVLAVHYRGSWGVKGTFSFQHAIEDADAEVAFVLDPANAKKYRIDTGKIALLGHSMGGYLVASAAAHEPKVAGIAMISAWNIGASFPPPESGERQHDTDEKAKESLTKDFTESNNVIPLAGCTVESLVNEIYERRASLNFDDFAAHIASRPVLVVSSEDGLAPADQAFAEAVKKNGNAHVTEAHFLTDHSYSDQRIALTTAVLNWLTTLR